MAVENSIQFRKQRVSAPCSIHLHRIFGEHPNAVPELFTYVSPELWPMLWNNHLIKGWKMLC